MDWQEIVVAGIGIGVVCVLLRALLRLRREGGRNACAGCGVDCPRRRTRSRKGRHRCERPHEERS